MTSASDQCDGDPRWPRRALLAALSAIVAFSPIAADAQTAQLPSTTYVPDPTAAPSWGSPAVPSPPSSVYGGMPAPDFNPYTGGQAVPVYGSPYGAPAGAPPATSLPYTYSSPVANQAPIYGGSVAAPVAPSYDYSAPPPSAGLYSEGTSLGWQPGTYGFQQADGSTVRYRQFLARLRFEHTYLMGDNSADAFEVNRTEVASTFSLPFAGSIESPLLLTPGFAFNWFSGPESDPAAVPRGPDMPPLVYDAYLDAAWYPQWTPELGAELGIRTGVWTDFKEVNDDSVRLLGRGLGVVSITPQFEFLLGAVYLDRLRVKLLPAGGVRWRPSPMWDLYLVFPNPKIRRRWFSSGSADWWWYAAGEYGGGSWTFERAGFGDRGDYNDLRILTGLEWQTPRQATGHLEIGYAFDRELRFESGAPSRGKLDDAIMFRAGIGY